MIFFSSHHTFTMEGSTSLFSPLNIVNKSNLSILTAVGKEEQEQEEKEMENLDSPDMLIPDDDHSLDNDADNETQQWKFFGQVVPKTEVIFFCQVIILYIVIIACIINLSLRNGDSNLYTALLSSSLGIILPSPSLTRRKLSSQLRHGLPN